MADAELPEVGADKPDAEQFGRGLGPGLGVNLLVTDVLVSARFQVRVLGAEAAYLDDDFAIMRHSGTTWMLHHDRTYRNHPLVGIAQGADGRGAGIELRIYGCDPDEAVRKARAEGVIVLAEAADKPHGLREAYLIDTDGYVWVPSAPKSDPA